MFSPKPKVSSPPSRRQEEPGREIRDQGNPNVIPGWDFPSDKTFGLSRRDVYPGKHDKNWFMRLLDKFVF